MRLADEAGVHARIADIRDTRNAHEDELKELSFDDKWDRCVRRRVLCLPCATSLCLHI